MQSTEVPEYRTLAPSFFEPNLVPAGATVRFKGAPGPHLQPLNKAAYDRMEAWYNEEIDEIDVKTQRKTGERIRPHAQYRVAAFTPTDHHEAEVLSMPAHDDSKKLMTLAEAMNARARATDQRPGPAMELRGGYQPPLEADAVVEEIGPAPEPSVEVIVAAPVSPTAGRRVG